MREPEFVDGEQVRVAGFAGDYTRAQILEIPALWEKFNAALYALGDGPVGRADGFTYAVIVPDAVMHYLAGIALVEGAAAPEGWEEMTVPAARFAVFRGEGGVEGIRAAWTSIFSQWLPQSGKKVEAGAMLERYREDWVTTGEFEIWVPMERGS